MFLIVTKWLFLVIINIINGQQLSLLLIKGALFREPLFGNSFREPFPGTLSGHLSTTRGLGKMFRINAARVLGKMFPLLVPRCFGILSSIVCFYCLLLLNGNIPFPITHEFLRILHEVPLADCTTNSQQKQAKTMQTIVLHFLMLF